MQRKLIVRARKMVAFLKKNAIKIVIGLPVCIATIVFLSKIPETAAAIEHITADNSSGLGKILKDPVNAPYKIVVYLSTALTSSILALRAVSIALLVGTGISLFYTLKHWHTKQAAGLATLAFCTNAVVLGVGRLGTPLVMVFGWFLFTSMLLWQVYGRSNKVVPGTVILATATLLYIPGAPWFFAVFLFFYWNRFKQAFNNVKATTIAVGAVLGLLIITPLVLGFIRTPSSAVEWLLLPDTVSLKTIYSSILEVPSAYIYRMQTNALINVGSLPVFDLASGFLFLIGLNAYRKKLQLDRTRLMIAIAIVGIIIGALGQVTVAVVLLLPFAFSMIAAGIEYLLDEWNGIFPKNPFARSFGVTMIAAVVLFGAYYQLTRFFVVWPQTPETREVYDQKRIIE